MRSGDAPSFVRSSRQKSNPWRNTIVSPSEDTDGWNTWSSVNEVSCRSPPSSLR